jgi:hypothetical protein
VSVTVPSSNSDGTRPADIERLDVYAFTGPATASDDEIVRWGQLIASVAVKAPADPDDTIAPDDPDADLEPLVGSGLDQGVVAHVRDELTGIASASEDTVRTYVTVGISTRGRRGLMSPRVVVPLTPAPAAPERPAVTYNASAINVAWTPAPASAAPAEEPLVNGYFVYEVPPGAAPLAKGTLLTPAPVAQPPFADTRIEWGVERCYSVSAVEARGNAIVESEASAPTCVRLTDSFPPPVPTGLVAVPSATAVNLSWVASPADDLAGYIVLRREQAATAFTPVTNEPIQETTYRDSPPTGTVYVYSVQAVDTSGNVSGNAEPVEAAAR